MLSKPSFAIGTYLTGKWKQHSYQIVGFLGEGANGKVYLVKKGLLLYALKMGFSAFDLQSEVNVLKSIEVHRKKQAYLIDVDDVHHAGKDYPFYVMAYIKGVRFDEHLKQRGKDWFYIIGKHLLEALCHLHQQGWIFGDLNKDNVIITGYGEVELIDYGGVTSKGRAVKQFTEINDRGFWRAGTREADEAYDLFSFAILCLQSIDERGQISTLLQHRDMTSLIELFRTNPYCEPLLPFFIKAINGQFRSSEQACEEWSKLILQRECSETLHMPVKWLKGAFLTSAVTLASTLYLVLQ